MKKKTLKSRIDYSFLYDQMLFRDIELDLKKEKKVTGKQDRLPKGKKASAKRKKKL